MRARGMIGREEEDLLLNAIHVALTRDGNALAG